jgi:FkbM family methyltransferase
MIKSLIADILSLAVSKSKHLQRFVNTHYDTDFDGLFNDSYHKENGMWYKSHNLLYANDIPCLKDYRLDIIRRSDIVLDIGATGGGYAIPASLRAKHVYAVEPLYPALLRENLEINDITNVSVIEVALGNSGSRWLQYYKTKKEVYFLPLKNILELCNNKIDVLKCDCQGGEHTINISDLSGIRNIDMEIHDFTGKRKFDPFLTRLNESGINYTSKTMSNVDMMVYI